MSTTPPPPPSPSPTSTTATLDSVTPTSSDTASTTPEPVPRPQRKASYYPSSKENAKIKPFSRSAAKRESVMMLGSIEHLQHYFTKQGIAARQRPSKLQSHLVPALGPAHLTPTSSSNALSTAPGDLPPSPIVPLPRAPALPAVDDVRAKVDPDVLRRGVVRALDEVQHIWAGGPGGDDLAEGFKVLPALQRTTHLIRAVRNYVISLPDPEPSHLHPLQPSHTGPPRTTYRSSSLAGPRPRVSLPKSEQTHDLEPGLIVRRAALELLEVLRQFEEGARVGEAEPEEGKEEMERERALSPFSTGTAASERGPSPLGDVPVWPNSDAEDGAGEGEGEGEERRRGAWDERLVLGGGFLYRADVRRDELAGEREAVGKYLGVVDEVLFGGPAGGERGWKRHAVAAEKGGRRASGGGSRRGSAGEGERRAGRRVVSAMGMLERTVVTEEPDGMESGADGEERMGMLHEVEEGDEEAIDEEDEEEEEGRDGVVEDEDLPEWAQRSSFADDFPGRLNALLLAHLPPHLLPSLPSPSSSPSDLLTALSSGQLLCAAYNVVVRRSRKPWGYVDPAAVHDVLALDGNGKDGKDGKGGGGGGWTFRRTENLRVWAAACKLRYLLPFAPVPTPESKQKQGHVEIVFDPKVVAAHAEGWEGMLEAAVRGWVERVVKERRGEGWD